MAHTIYAKETEHHMPFKCKFLRMPSYLDRLSGECLKIFLNSSSVSASQSFELKLRISGIGVNSTVLLGCEKRFQGHTSWHTSQPNIQLSKRLCIFSGINISFSSMVK